MNAPIQMLSGTGIPLSWAKSKSKWLIANATRQGDCLICHLRPNQKGYSNVSFGRQVHVRAHRLIYFCENIDADPLLLVCHTCDVRNCINLDHLYLGTEADNTRDMMDKGRGKYIARSNQKVDPNKIRELRAQGLLYKEIAKILNVSKSTITNYMCEKGPYYDR